MEQNGSSAGKCIILSLVHYVFEATYADENLSLSSVTIVNFSCEVCLLGGGGGGGLKSQNQLFRSRF